MLKFDDFYSKKINEDTEADAEQNTKDLIDSLEEIISIAKKAIAMKNKGLANKRGVENPEDSPIGKSPDEMFGGDDYAGV